MQKHILKKIQKAQAATLCNVEILPRRRGKGKADYIKRVRRDADGNHCDKDGNIVLSHILTKEKPLSPSAQFRLSPFSLQGQMLRAMRKERQAGSEIGLDKKFEKDLNNG